MPKPKSVKPLVYPSGEWWRRDDLVESKLQRPNTYSDFDVVQCIELLNTFDGYPSTTVKDHYIGKLEAAIEMAYHRLYKRTREKDD